MWVSFEHSCSCRGELVERLGQICTSGIALVLHLASTDAQHTHDMALVCWLGQAVGVARSSRAFPTSQQKPLDAHAVR
jgi:hypothetical protein